MINYALADVNEKVVGVITLIDNEIPNLIMNGVEFLLGGTFVSGENEFVNFTLIPMPVKEDSKNVIKSKWCCAAEKTRGPNTEGKMVCPIHCSKCGHNRKFEDYLDFCRVCHVGDPCNGSMRR